MYMFFSAYVYLIMFAKLIQSKSNISTKVVSQLIINQLFNITVKQPKLASDGHTMSQTDHQFQQKLKHEQIMGDKYL